jgi:hypothetical protein
MSGCDRLRVHALGLAFYDDVGRHRMSLQVGRGMSIFPAIPAQWYVGANNVAPYVAVECQMTDLEDPAWRFMSCRGIAPGADSSLATGRT